VGVRLAEELVAMGAADLRSAPGAGGDDPEAQLAWRRLTVRHGDRLGQIMDEHGWPTVALVGAEAGIEPFAAYVRRNSAP
jgi:hypothetical protein